MAKYWTVWGKKIRLVHPGAVGTETVYKYELDGSPSGWTKSPGVEGRFMDHVRTSGPIEDALPAGVVSLVGDFLTTPRAKRREVFTRLVSAFRGMGYAPAAAEIEDLAKAEAGETSFGHTAAKLREELLAQFWPYVE